MSSIRARLLVILLVGLTCVLAAGGAAVYMIVGADLVGQFDDGLESRAHTLASLVKLEPDGLVFETGDAPPATMAETSFELRTASGSLLKRSSNLADQSLPTKQLVDGAVTFADLPLPDSTRGRAIWMAFRPRADPDDWEGLDVGQVDRPLLVVAAALDRGPLDRALGTLLSALIVVCVVAAISAGIMMLVGVRWGLVPLERLRNQLESVNDRTISNRLNDTGAPAELMPVYLAVNGMLDRVERTLERERSFARAAAHELRTPLAELRSTAEVSLKWPDHERAIAALTESLAIGRDMERLVESLLGISRGHMPAASSEADVTLASIVRRSLDRLNGAIAEKHLRLAINLNGAESRHGQHRAPMPGEAMDIIIRNLIENAVHYTPIHGDISIEDGNNSSNAAHDTLFTIENGPVHLVATDLPRLFEPFWRQESSRTDRRHAGLGLSVVSHVAEAIGLRVEASLAGDRLRMQVCGAASRP